MRRRSVLWGLPLAAASAWLGRTFELEAQSAPAKRTPIPRRKLGRTGVEVSLIGLGGYHIGVQKDARESIRIIRAALDEGVNFLDNCWDYHEGESEVRMGNALRDGYRDKAFLMSKIDGRTRASAAKQIDESLKRLQTDRIDLMQIHEIIRASDPARVFGPGGTMEALTAAQKAGKVRFIGFTGHKSGPIHRQMLEAATRHGVRFDTVQMPLNVMDAHDEGFEKIVLPMLVKDEIGVLAMKPMGSGLILKAGRVTPVQCLHYAMSLPTSTVITGCDSMKVLQQALLAARTFRPWDEKTRQTVLARTAKPSSSKKFELYKSTDLFDGTERNPHWLG